MELIEGCGEIFIHLGDDVKVIFKVIKEEK
jgi:hypothetical protein